MNRDRVVGMKQIPAAVGVLFVHARDDPAGAALPRLDPRAVAERLILLVVLADVAMSNVALRAMTGAGPSLPPGAQFTGPAALNFCAPPQLALTSFPFPSLSAR